jgi:hypothetical protein
MTTLDVAPTSRPLSSLPLPALLDRIWELTPELERYTFDGSRQVFLPPDPSGRGPVLAPLSSLTPKEALRLATALTHRNRLRHGLDPETGSPLTRTRLETLAWERAPEDYRSERPDGTRTLLYLDPRTGGTCVGPLAVVPEAYLRRLVGVRSAEVVS